MTVMDGQGPAELELPARAGSSEQAAARKGEHVSAAKLRVGVLGMG